MIAIFEGKIGGGKTYLAVSRILAHLASGGVVFTNIELKLDGVEEYLRTVAGVEFDPTAVRILDESESWDFHKYLRSGVAGLNSLCVIDEAHLWFNARDHSVTAATKRELITFLSQSRKLNVDVIFIVQAAENLDAQFRRLAQEIWRMKDLARFKLPILDIAYPWPHTMAFRMDTGNNMVMEKKLLKRSPIIWNAYNTNALLRPVEFAGEVELKRELKRVSAESRWNDLLKWQPSPNLVVWILFVALLSLRLAYG